MDKAYWLNKWAKQDIGFHEVAVNPALETHWPVAMRSSDRVLVPLCGMTVDMAWLASRGHEVVGVEFSEKAAAGFFDNAGLTPQINESSIGKRYSCGSVSILVGDFFSLTGKDAGQFDCVYDRASLVAVEPSRRDAYVATLERLLGPGGDILLVTLEYDQTQMNGPPFNVDETVLDAYFEPPWRRRLLERNTDALTTNAKFRNRGVDTLSECVWHLGQPEG